jgi:hypothetical protein
MALTDLKSDLSKFRIPFKQKSIEETQAKHTNIVYSTKTPIDDKIDEVAKIALPKGTPEKIGFKAEKIKEKIELESQPLPSISKISSVNTLESQPLPSISKISSVNNNLSQNLKINGLSEAGRYADSNFDTNKIESNFSNQSPIVGTGKSGLNESLESNFSNQSPIVGTNKSGLNESLESKFSGQTDPNKMSLESKFLGQTEPTIFNFSPNFTTIEPNKFNTVLDKDSQAITPTPVDFFSNTDSVGFTPNIRQMKTDFVDAQTANTFSERIKNSKLKTVNFFSNEDAVGFTKNFNPGSKSQFRGISSNGGEFTSNKPTTKLGVVDFFPNEDAVGFTKEFVDKTKSQFTGISSDGKKFISPKVTFGGDFGLSFLPGSKIKLEGSAAKYYQVGSQKWQPGGKRYEDKYVSIGDLLIKENSPSYLTKIYNQFNLKDDSFNPYPLFFRQPFILRGIQRKGKKEPQKWGFGLGSVDSLMGVDLIRGGVLTSTERALVDVARIGQFILSPKGIVWSIMQVGMQLTNRFNKIWTPANLLIAVGGQHIGLKPKRHGLLPFDKIDVGNYERAFPLGRGKYKDKLEDFRKSIIVLGGLGNFGSNVLLETQFGGPESVYGIGISTIRTSTNTFSNPEKTYGDTKAGFVQKYNPIFEKPIELDIPLPKGSIKLPAAIKIPRDVDKSFEDTYGKEFGVIENNLGGSTKNTTDLSKLGLLNKIINFNYPFQLIDNFGNSLYTNQSGNKNTHWTQKYSPILDEGSGSTVQFGFNDADKGTNTYENKAPRFADDDANWEDFGLSGKIFNSEYDDINLFSSDDKSTLKTLWGEEALNYKNITDLSFEDGSYRDFRTKYKPDGDKIKKLKKGIHKTYFGEDGKDYYTNNNIEKRVGLGKSDEYFNNTDNSNETVAKLKPDLIRLGFKQLGDTKYVQFRGTVNSISETFTPNWTEVKYSGRAENAYIYDTFTRELNFGFRVYAYTAKELLIMWARLGHLSKMTMPSYVSGNGYYGHIIQFTLGTMYKDFPALISTLQYSVPDEFTWEIGLNKDANGNELPMGVDVTIGLKLLGHGLHQSYKDDNNPHKPYYDAKLYGDEGIKNSSQ